MKPDNEVVSPFRPMITLPIFNFSIINSKEYTQIYRNKGITLSFYLIEKNKPILWLPDNIKIDSSLEYFNDFIDKYDIAYNLYKKREISTDIVWLNNTEVSHKLLKCWYVQILAFPEKQDNINLRDCLKIFPYKNKLRFKNLREVGKNGKIT